MKPLLLYTPIYSYTAELFVEKLLEVEASEDQEFWINSPGGSVFAGWSILGPLDQRTGKNNAKVFGSADSMVAYMLLFMDNVEALDTSTFRLHRADGYVDSDEDRALLLKINKDLRSKMTKKIDAKVFKEVTGHTFDEMFDSKKRIDIDLDAKQAKKIGLINSIIRLEPKQIAAMSETLIAFADFGTETQGSATAKKQEQGSSKEQNINSINKIEEKQMTKNEFKAQFPGEYAAIVLEGHTAGVTEEKDRIEAFLEFVEIDAESVKTQISEGKAMTGKFMAEMTKKMTAKAIKTDAASEQTPEQILAAGAEKTAAEIEAAKFEKDVDGEMGFKEEVK